MSRALGRVGCVGRGYLCFSSAVLVDAAMCMFQNVLLVNDVLLGCALCAGRIYPGFISILDPGSAGYSESHKSDTCFP